MLKVMAKMENCKIDECIRRDGKLINLKLSYNLDSKSKSKYIIYFIYSLFLLPSSLRKLGNSFSVDVKKSIYPYKFVNDKNIDLNYIGNIQYFDKFSDITQEEYLDYCKLFEI
jgi:hypothetical protein